MPGKFPERREDHFQSSDRKNDLSSNSSGLSELQVVQRWRKSLCRGLARLTWICQSVLGLLGEEVKFPQIFFASISLR